MTRIPMFEELKFEERTHAYVLEGATIPSVTRVMWPLSAAYYGDIDGLTLAKAARRGTEVHHAIENWLKFGVDDVPPEYAGYYKAFRRWHEESKPEVVGTEFRAYHKVLRYAGTCDMACAVAGKLVLVDYKTSYQVVDMLARVQLEAYARACESHGLKFEGKAILHLQKDGGYSVKEYAPGDVEAWDVFCGCLTVRNYLGKHGR